MRIVNISALLPPLGRAALAYFRLATGLAPGAMRRRPGQNTVEYLLMLSVIASMTLALVILFHKKLLGGIFTIAGMVIGAGTPKNN